MGLTGYQRDIIKHMQAFQNWVISNAPSIIGRLKAINWYAITTLILSFFSAYMVWKDHKRKIEEKKLNVEVKLSTGFFTYPEGAGEAMLFIEVINKGEVALTISSVYLKISKKNSLFSTQNNSNVNLPHKLDPRTSFKVWFKYKDLAETLRQQKYKGKINVWGAARDQTDTLFLSKPSKINLNEMNGSSFGLYN